MRRAARHKGIPRAERRSAHATKHEETNVDGLRMPAHRPPAGQEAKRRPEKAPLRWWPIASPRICIACIALAWLGSSIIHVPSHSPPFHHRRQAAPAPLFSLHQTYIPWLRVLVSWAVLLFCTRAAYIRYIITRSMRDRVRHKRAVP